MEKSELLRIRVVYALPDQQPSVDLQVPPGTSLTEAVNLSGLLQKFPEAAARPLACAIFGRAVPLTARAARWRSHRDPAAAADRSQTEPARSRQAQPRRTQRRK